ncbi:MAG: substrate-binding domain-containing protein [Cyanobacteria bacterium J06600_6]
MLHKRHNSVVTLAILLTLVGVSKPAKAFLLAQSDTAPATFTVPDKLSEDATVKITTSNSTDSINASLQESFTNKYPQAEIETETQDSSAALNRIAEGQADLAAIGRNLTAEEKAKGFATVPVSREKIAIIISTNNPYDGNLTIDQFAQIFRGEITDWSEIGGAPGAIELVDLPDANDTRQAFPNYPIFQSAEFSTGATATQLEEDSTEAAIAQLGDNSISYAVANDVINRDDVKIVTMHTTQPDDPRYPFSQPFNLIYQGTPSEAAQAYLGYATAEGGQEIVASRVGSISTAAISTIAAGAAGLTNQTDLSPDPDANADVAAETEIDPTADVDADASADLASGSGLKSV